MFLIVHRSSNGAFDANKRGKHNKIKMQVEFFFLIQSKICNVEIPIWSLALIHTTYYTGIESVDYKRSALTRRNFSPQRGLHDEPHQGVLGDLQLAWTCLHQQGRVHVGKSSLGYECFD